MYAVFSPLVQTGTCAKAHVDTTEQQEKAQLFLRLLSSVRLKLSIKYIFNLCPAYSSSWSS